MEVENKRRRPFTPGWAESLTTVQGLPIKQGGKIVKVVREKSNRPKNVEEDENERIIDSDAEDNEEDEVKSVPKKNEKAITTIQIEVQHTSKSPKEIEILKLKIADICTNIAAEPEKGFSKYSKTAQESSHIEDLFELCISADAMEVELALFSTALVFKDVCPSYRIRHEEKDKTDDHKMKKDTKKLIDFEKALLRYYQRFLQILERRAQAGLSSSFTYNHLHDKDDDDREDFDTLKEIPLSKWKLSQKIGFVALRCQCELIKSLSHFNFRSTLLSSVSARGASSNHSQIVSLCCETIEYLLKHDVLGELSFEFVSNINKLMKITKFTMSKQILRCLELVKVTVPADKSKTIHIQAKQQKKKRKHDRDDVEVGILEANANVDDLNKKRFQVNSLQEISLIYFRILKLKVGFRLLPTALAGLSRITHLLDMDMVLDLLNVLKSLLEAQPQIPFHARVLCLECAFKTLSGPGQELKVDDEPYLSHLRHVLREVPSQYPHWFSILNCIEVVLLKRREERTNIVTSVLRLLLLNVSYRLHDIGMVIMTLVQTILLRYPRVRQDFRAIHFTSLSVLTKSQIQTKMLQDDDIVEDFAMRALHEGEATKNGIIAADDEEEKLGDGSWIFPMINQYVDPRYSNLVGKMTKIEMINFPMRLTDAEESGSSIIFNRLEQALSLCPSSLISKTQQSNSKPTENKNKNNKKSKKN